MYCKYMSVGGISVRTPSLVTAATFDKVHTLATESFAWGVCVLKITSRCVTQKHAPSRTAKWEKQWQVDFFWSHFILSSPYSLPPCVCLSHPAWQGAAIHPLMTSKDSQESDFPTDPPAGALGIWSTLGLSPGLAVAFQRRRRTDLCLTCASVCMRTPPMAFQSSALPLGSLLSPEFLLPTPMEAQQGGSSLGCLPRWSPKGAY